MMNCSERSTRRADHKDWKTKSSVHRGSYFGSYAGLKQTKKTSSSRTSPSSDPPPPLPRSNFEREDEDLNIREKADKFLTRLRRKKKYQKAIQRKKQREKEEEEEFPHVHHRAHHQSNPNHLPKRFMEKGVHYTREGKTTI